MHLVMGFLVFTLTYTWGENGNSIDTYTCNAKPSGTKELVQELELENYLTDGAQWMS